VAKTPAPDDARQLLFVGVEEYLIGRSMRGSIDITARTASQDGKKGAGFSVLAFLLKKAKTLNPAPFSRI
jgi:hypothetical protein